MCTVVQSIFKNSRLKSHGKFTALLIIGGFVGIALINHFRIKIWLVIWTKNMEILLTNKLK